MTESDGPQTTVGLPSIIRVCTMVMFFIIVIVQVVVAAVYGNDCPKQPFIPTYLYGPLIIYLVLYWCGKCNVISCCLTIAFSISWLIAGSVLIYSIYEPNYDKNTTKTDAYCNKTLYLFAFWTTTVTYGLLGVFLLSCCCCERREPGPDDAAETLLQG